MLLIRLSLRLVSHLVSLRFDGSQIKQQTQNLKTVSCGEGAGEGLPGADDEDGGASEDPLTGAETNTIKV